jgi:hypothetical protein
MVLPYTFASQGLKLPQITAPAGNEGHQVNASQDASALLPRSHQVSGCRLTPTSGSGATKFG